MSLSPTQSRLVLVAAFVLLVPAAIEAQCLEYGAPDTKLFAELKRRVFPGRQNHDSMKRGDQPDSAWVLRLDRSICLKATADVPAMRRISEVQLISDDRNAVLRGALDRRVVFRGQLAPATTGHHHLPVVFFAKVYIVELERPGSAAVRSLPAGLPGVSQTMEGYQCDERF